MDSMPDNENVSNVVKPITDEIREILQRPLPDGAVTPHPTKKFLSNIKGVYITERLNEAFGIGSWYTEDEIIERAADKAMVVLKVTLHIPSFGIKMSAYGGNDNPDRGDSYKGAVTDALSKIASYLDIAKEVFKGQHNSQPGNQVKAVPQDTDNRPWINDAQVGSVVDRIKAARAGTTSEDPVEISNKAMATFKVSKANQDKIQQALKS